MQPRHNEIAAFLRAALGVSGTGPTLARLWQYCERQFGSRATYFLALLYEVGRNPTDSPADGQPGREAVLTLLQPVGYDAHLVAIEMNWGERIRAGSSTTADMIFALELALKLGNNFLFALRKGVLTEPAFRHIVSPELVACLPWEIVLPWFFEAVRCSGCGNHSLMRAECQCGTPLPRNACANCGFVGAPAYGKCVACGQDFKMVAADFVPWYEGTDPATVAVLANIITISFGFSPQLEDAFWCMVGWSHLIVGLPTERLCGMLETLYATGTPFTNAVVRKALPVTEVVARVPREVIVEQYFDLVLGWLGGADFPATEPRASPSPVPRINGNPPLPADEVVELVDDDVALDET